MPNVGKPSGGCYACRRMRVKCDERKPGCLRCERGGRDCPGYRQEPLVFRSMNATSEALALFPRPRRRPTHSPAPASSRKEERRTSQSPYRRTSASSNDSLSPVATSKRRSSGSPLKNDLNTSLSASWEDVAVTYYLSKFIIASESGSETKGYFDCLPDLLSESSDMGHLAMALRSVALSALGNRSCMQQLKIQGRRSYGQALSQVNLALNDFAMAKADATLAALILLGQYEIISGDRPGNYLWMSHGEGQAILLGMRGTTSLQEDRSRQLFRIAQQGLQMSGVASQASRKIWQGEPPAPLFTSPMYRQFYDFNDSAFKASRELVVHLQDGWRGDVWYEKLHRTVLRQEEILAEAESIAASCKEQSMFWLARTHDTLSSTETHGTQNDSPAHLPSYIYLFPDIVTASNLIYFWAVRTKLLDDLLASASLLKGAQYSKIPSRDALTLRAQLLTSIDDMCAAIPFLLGELDSHGALTVAGAGTCVGAYNALWPLHVLSSLREVDSARHEWILARLAQVGAVFGIRQASLLREYWVQRSLGTTSHEVIDGDEVNVDPGSVWFPI